MKVSTPCTFYGNDDLSISSSLFNGIFFSLTVFPHKCHFSTQTLYCFQKNSFHALSSTFHVKSHSNSNFPHVICIGAIHFFKLKWKFAQKIRIWFSRWTFWKLLSSASALQIFGAYFVDEHSLKSSSSALWVREWVNMMKRSNKSET